MRERSRLRPLAKGGPAGPPFWKFEFDKIFFFPLSRLMSVSNLVVPTFMHSICRINVEKFDRLFVTIRRVCYRNLIRRTRA
jgi:hypothetical protein